MIRAPAETTARTASIQAAVVHRHGRLRSVADRVCPGIRTVDATIPVFERHWQDANRSALTRSGPVWVVLGDSISQGIGAARFDAGWVGQLAERMSRSGQQRRVINLSRSGARVGDVVERQLPAIAALGLNPDLVTVLVGTNDLLRRAYRAELPTMFGMLLDAVPRGTVVATMSHPFPVAHHVNALIDAAVARGRVRQAAKQVHLTSWPALVAADHFHPNEAGHACIADNFATAIGLADGDGDQAGRGLRRDPGAGEVGAQADSRSRTG